jgi:release factor glutamine methyltransferase
MNVPCILSWAEDLLARAGVPSPRVDAEWMLVYVLCCKRSDLALNTSLQADQIKTYRSLVAQRSKRIPLQHLLGETEFYGLRFESTAAALIPRPDTETLVEAVVHSLRPFSAPQILDMGTGTGIIAISLAHEIPLSCLWAVDICKIALALARRNAHLNHVQDRIHLIQGHLFSGIKTSFQFDAIVSNPPYIPTADLSTLEPEVRDHDPRLALDGGADGLDFYRQIIPQSIPHLKANGFLAMEIGYNQTDAVADLISHHSQLGQTTAKQDLTGHNRILICRKKA